MDGRIGMIEEGRFVDAQLPLPLNLRRRCDNYARVHPRPTTGEVKIWSLVSDFLPRLQFEGFYAAAPFQSMVKSRTKASGNRPRPEREREGERELTQEEVGRGRRRLVGNCRGNRRWNVQPRSVTVDKAVPGVQGPAFQGGNLPTLIDQAFWSCRKQTRRGPQCQCSKNDNEINDTATLL